MKLQNFNMLMIVVVLARVGVVMSKNHRWMSTIGVAFLLSANIISGWLYLYYNGVGIQTLAKTLVPVSFGIMGLTCLGLSVVHRENYIKLINEAMREFETEFPVATKESKGNLFLVNMYVFGFAFCEFLVFVLYTVDPFFKETLVLPFPILFPFKTDTAALYTLAYIFEMSFSFLGGTVILVTAVFFCNLMEQTCMRFDNLANKIRDILEDEGNTLLSSKETDDNLLSSLQEFLKECVHTHIKLRRRIRVLDETFSAFFLLGVLGYVPTVSGSILEFVSFRKLYSSVITTNHLGHDLRKETGLWEDLLSSVTRRSASIVAVTLVGSVEYGSEETVIYYMKFGTVMVGGLFMVFIPSHCGSRIVDAQFKIPETLLSYKWTRYPESIQRTLSIIFAVGQVPVCVTAGGIMTLDLVGYSQITGLVYSIFTLLNHFKRNANT